MPLNLSDLQTPLTKEAVRTILEELLTDAGMPVDAWQDEGAARAFLEGASGLGAELSQRIAELSKAGYLSTSEADFLTARVKSEFDEDRNAAVASVFDTSFANSSATTYGPFAAGGIIVRSSDGQVFESTGAETITAGTTTTVELKAQVAGAAGNIDAQTLQLVTSMAGVTVGFGGSFTTAGAEAERDPQLQERARTKWATLRVSKVSDGIRNLVRSVAPAVHGIAIDDDNPRGAGTVDVYLAAETATAGSGDVTLAQAALDDAFLGNGSVDQRVKAFAAPTAALNVGGTLYVSGTTSTQALANALAAWQDFLLTVPVGGFNLSPGPTNTVLRGQIIKALAAAAGVDSIDLTTPSTDQTISADTKVIEGTFTFAVVIIG